MTKPALCSLWIGIGLVVLVSLFPPWAVGQQLQSHVVAGTGPYGYVDRGYRFLFDPPTDSINPSYHFINLSRLVIIWVIIGSITLGAIITFNSTANRSSEKSVGQGGAKPS